MNRRMSFSFIGGDQRQISVICAFAAKGHRVSVFGLENVVFPDSISIHKSETLRSCMENSDIVVLPLPYVSKADIIRSPYSNSTIKTHDILEQMNPSQLLFVGIADECLKKMAQAKNIRYIDYGCREELLIQNAVPTVEGALEIAMRETEHTIHNSQCLVLGYGRIGKLLGKNLSALGAHTTISARKKRDLAWISASGLRGISFQELPNCIGDFDIIFNTVPSLILGFPLLTAVSDDALIIDLASKPGGIDFESAKVLQKKVVWALSLPGKVAPKTAGNIISDTIQNILDELEV